MTHYLTFRATNEPGEFDASSDRIRADGATSALSYFTTGNGPSTLPTTNSAVWVDNSSAGAAAGSGAWVDTTGDIHPDDDPVGGHERPTMVIDIFSALSAKLGKQVAQEKIAYVESIGIRILNSGNGGNNNEESASFAGSLAWYTPKQDRIRAYKLYRAAHRIMSKDDTSDNLLFSPDNKYTALRVGPFSGKSAGDGTVMDQTPDLLTDVPDTWANLTEIFTAYDIKNNVLDAVGAAVQKGTPSNLHWVSGRCRGQPDIMHWSASVANPKSGGPGAGHGEFLWVGPQISLMNGLLVLTVDDSTTTNSWTGANWADEEYSIEVCIGLKGWKGIA